MAYYAMRQITFVQTNSSFLPQIHSELQIPGCSLSTLTSTTFSPRSQSIQKPSRSRITDVYFHSTSINGPYSLRAKAHTEFNGHVPSRYSNIRKNANACLLSASTTVGGSDQGDGDGADNGHNGGRGGDGGNDGNEDSGLPAFVLAIPGLAQRIKGNPRFVSVMITELLIGFFTKTLAEYSARGVNFWKEFDFYLSDIMLELVGDFSLVWLLANIATKGQPTGLAALPSHVLQIGNFTLSQRIISYFVKSIQFGLVGFFSSIVGHSITKLLVERRTAQRSKKGHKEKGPELAPVIPNSINWGLFMFISTTPRYQLVNGIEQRIFDVAFKSNVALNNVVTFALRFVNCYTGGVIWVYWAKWAGLQ